MLLIEDERAEGIAFVCSRYFDRTPEEIKSAILKHRDGHTEAQLAACIVDELEIHPDERRHPVEVG